MPWHIVDNKAIIWTNDVRIYWDTFVHIYQQVSMGYISEPEAYKLLKLWKSLEQGNPNSNSGLRMKGTRYFTRKKASHEILSLLTILLNP